MLLALLLAACGKRDAVGPDIALPDVVDGEAAVPGTEGEKFPDDPADGGWETESWSAAIQTQLNQLKAALLDGDIDPALVALAAQDCASTQLRPDRCEVLDSRVSRLPAGAEIAAAGSLGEALLELLEQFADATPSHASSKIIRISPLAGGRAETVIAVQLDGAENSAETVHLQVNARWECRWQSQADGTWWLQAVRLLAYEEVRAPAGAFGDATQAALGHDAAAVEQFFRGQDHWMARVEMRFGIDISGWQGLAVADVDRDGLEDIYVSQSGGLPNRLLRHRQDGTVEDISAAAGVDWLDTTHGSLFADLDNDSDPDLLVGVASGILIMENDGAGNFSVAATKLLPAGLAYSIAAADIDQDGDLDFFVCGYTARLGVSRHHLFVHPVPYHDANNGGRNAMFRNDGRWRFTDVTQACGMDQHNTRFSYAATWEDYDLDGDMDLYVANDFGRNNLYRNDLAQSGRVQFSDVAEEAGVVDIAPGMSACWGDYDNDGLADLYVGNMFSSAGNRIAAQPQFHAGADAETRSEFLRHARGNSLFHNIGDGKFADVGAELGVTLGRWAWSSKFADLDNDGWLDILVANGFITQEDTGDL